MLITNKDLYISILQNDKQHCVIITCCKCGRIKSTVQEEFISYRKLRRKAIKDWNSNCYSAFNNITE